MSAEKTIPQRSRGRSGSEDKHSTAEGRRNSLNCRVSYSKELGERKKESPLRKRAGGKDIKRIKANKVRQHQAGNERKEQERRKKKRKGREKRKKTSVKSTENPIEQGKERMSCR